jgi:hypothetical protein
MSASQDDITPHSTRGAELIRLFASPDTTKVSTDGVPCLAESIVFQTNGSLFPGTDTSNALSVIATIT